jgi:hypothetical protein
LIADLAGWGGVRVAADYQVDRAARQQPPVGGLAPADGETERVAKYVAVVSRSATAGT